LTGEADALVAELKTGRTVDGLACGYRNSSDRMVIVRCSTSQSFFLERVVFPFELLSFECPPDATLEIWTHGLGGPELVETIPARELAIEPGPPPGHLEAVAGGWAGDLADIGNDDLLESWVAAG
jgi:hypothetical protein